MMFKQLAAIPKNAANILQVCSSITREILTMQTESANNAMESGEFQEKSSNWLWMMLYVVFIYAWNAFIYNTIVIPSFGHNMLENILVMVMFVRYGED
tara:strand:+ start:5343 stop:5636 length:294 start_codon:yes stop_codon:yes gene_type:complete